MVSINRVRVIGSLYMALHGGYKPLTKPFKHFFKENSLKPKRIFFIGNRRVDMELADNLEKELGVKVHKCLIKRRGRAIIYPVNSVAVNLKQVLKLINEFKPDLVMSDFDNTLVHSGYDAYEQVAEQTMFWEKHAGNKALMIIHELLSLIISPLIIRKPYATRDDNTCLFFKKLKHPLIIHSMSSDYAIKRLINKIVKACN